MKMRSFFLSLIAVALTIPSAGAAEKVVKAQDFSNFPFWNSKKRGDAPQFVPGLTAALQLTDAQKEQLAAARDELANDEGVKASRGFAKGDSVTPEQKEKARAAMDAATTRMREKVAGILAPDQKALIAKINEAYATSVEEVGIVYSEKFASVKADEAARKRIQEDKNQDTEDRFQKRLDTLLTAPQKEAMTKAAEVEQQQRTKADAAAAAKKPAK